MRFSSGRLGLSALGASLAYLVALACLAAVTVGATWHLGQVVLEQLVPSASVPSRTERAAPAVRSASPIIPGGPQSLRSESTLQPLADRWEGRFGIAVSRPQSRGPFGWNDGEEERPEVVGTFRTLCVRLCDGYYFPINFAVTAERLARDRDVCESRCGRQGRLFVHRSVGETPDDMVDLQGRPYRQLKTAFLYRTEYVSSCKCRPDPWETEAQDRHRGYALAAAARNGNKEAAAELLRLQARMREAAKVAARPAAPPVSAEAPAVPAPQLVRQGEIADGETGPMMGLGGGAPQKPKGDPLSEPVKSSGSDRAWIKRVFDGGMGR